MNVASRHDANGLERRSVVTRIYRKVTCAAGPYSPFFIYVVLCERVFQGENSFSSVAHTRARRA